MAARVTELRRTLQGAIEPLLRDGEHVTVSAAPSDYDPGHGLDKLRFGVTITVGPAGDVAAEERLDELLSGVVKDALAATDPRPSVTKTSGYQTYAREDGPTLLGTTFTTEILDG